MILILFYDTVSAMKPEYFSLSIEAFHQASRVRLEVLPDAASLFQRMARSMADELLTNNRAGLPTRWILPVGPVGQYPLLVQLCNHERISWHNVHTFNMDEYCDWQGRIVPFEHPLSFRAYMHRVVFDQLDDALRIPQEQIHFPNPLKLDEISQAIQTVGGIDTCYGGIGLNGHVAFNEPPNLPYGRISADEFRRSLTRLVPLTPESIVMNGIRNTGGNLADFPPMGITLGMADILAAKRIRLYCPGGAWQRAVLRRAALDDEDVTCPVTLLQNHPDIILTADRETAAPPLPGL